MMYKRKIYMPYTVDQAVDISSKMYDMYTNNGVQVIRIGLQPTDSIAEGKDVIAGPFHPSMRALVEGNLISQKIINVVKGKKHIVININPKDISKLYADKKKYFKRITEAGIKAEVNQNINIKRNYVTIEVDKKEININF